MMMMGFAVMYKYKTYKLQYTYICVVVVFLLVMMVVIRITAQTTKKS